MMETCLGSLHPLALLHPLQPSFLDLPWILGPSAILIQLESFWKQKRILYQLNETDTGANFIAPVCVSACVHACVYVYVYI